MQLVAALEAVGVVVCHEGIYRISCVGVGVSACSLLLLMKLLLIVGSVVVLVVFF